MRPGESAGTRPSLNVARLASWQIWPVSGAGEASVALPGVVETPGVTSVLLWSRSSLSRDRAARPGFSSGFILSHL